MSNRYIEKLVAKWATSVSQKKRTKPKSHPVSPLVCPPRHSFAFYILSKSFKAQLRYLLSHGPIWVSDLQSCYQRRFGGPLRSFKFGYYTIDKLLESVSDMIYFQLTNMGAIITLRENMAPLEDLPMIENINFPIPIPSEEGDSGQCMVDLDWDINQQGRVAQQGQTSRFQGILEEDVLPVAVCQAETGYISVDTREGACGRNFQRSVNFEVWSPAMFSSPNSASDVLINQRLKRPTQHATRVLATISVVHVESPGHFYIIFSQSSEACAFQNMMLEMRQYYSVPDVCAGQCLPQRLIRRGQACCVSVMGIWYYRAVIDLIISPTQVAVYYVDFGTKCEEQNVNLKFLMMFFAHLPAQAVPSSLTRIKPVTNNWTPEATDSFRELSFGQSLVGALEGYTGDVLQLYLSKNYADIYFHDILLSREHGVACKPSASAALCVKDSPVSLYLGEGMIFLQDEQTTAPVNLDATSMPQVEVEQVPLMASNSIIENIFNSYFQRNLFSDQMTNPPLSCEEPSLNVSESPHQALFNPPDILSIHEAGDNPETPKDNTFPSVSTEPPVVATPLTLDLYVHDQSLLQDSLQDIDVSAFTDMSADLDLSALLCEVITPYDPADG
ncbi:tudor domain-containing protein 5-like isoform X1 [Entelurus aequoreus]|uniref:tudor domain-containing protein 5-like isoform X1 n=2 Tax=Entelurus aequoreus TaxID=161455 RepID=UPI002B1DDE4D|nr:tudor domain-containing protein 5-like isoform X1 [Entelurus aequoreus]XP_061921371.1 tudor domain-containing protein 5-like isoform X1 [Entelurus aequoreus]